MLELAESRVVSFHRTQLEIEIGRTIPTSN